VVDYTGTIRNHLSPAFGTEALERLAASPETFDRYITGKLKEGAVSEDRPEPRDAARPDVPDCP